MFNSGLEEEAEEEEEVFLKEFLGFGRLDLVVTAAGFTTLALSLPAA